MNTALLVLRIIPGLLLMGHGLQKLVPPGYSPPLLHAAGHRGTGAGFESLGIRPAVAAAVLAGSAELAAGFSLAAGLLTPVGTVLVGAVMITAILKVHASNGIWAAEGGFEFPLVLLTVGFAITALGPGSLSVDSWLGIDNWAGIHWTINPAARSAIALAIGLAGGLVVALASWASKRTPDPREPAGSTLMPYAYGKPDFPHVSCNNGPNGDIFMDYMDYVDDAAMFMFTQGQAARMNATLAGPRKKLAGL